MTVVIRLIAPATPPLVGDPPPSGSYLRSIDPDAHDGLGEASWTLDPDEAMTFDTPIQAMEIWRTQSTVRPYRPDGKPNRPLTSMSVEIGAL